MIFRKTTAASPPDERRFGWVIRQKRMDRQETVLFSNAFLHNLYVIRITPN
jgi:transposase